MFCSVVCPNNIVIELLANSYDMHLFGGNKDFIREPYLLTNYNRKFCQTIEKHSFFFDQCVELLGLVHRVSCRRVNRTFS